MDAAKWLAVLCQQLIRSLRYNSHHLAWKNGCDTLAVLGLHES